MTSDELPHSTDVREGEPPLPVSNKEKTAAPTDPTEWRPSQPARDAEGCARVLMSSGGGGVVGLVVGMTMAASVGPVDWRLDPVSHMFLELAPYAFTIAGAIVGGIVGLVFSLNSAR